MQKSRQTSLTHRLIDFHFHRKCVKFIFIRFIIWDFREFRNKLKLFFDHRLWQISSSCNENMLNLIQKSMIA